MRCRVQLFIVKMGDGLSSVKWLIVVFKVPTSLKLQTKISSMRYELMNLVNFILNISEEIQDLTAKDIGQKLGTLGRHMGHWADIKNIKQTYVRHMGH